jgi:chitin deacetylase
MRKRLLIIVPLIVLVAAATLWQISKSRTFQFFGTIVPRVNTEQRVVALTFDDGPTKGATDEVLKVLNEANVKATFFLIGAELEQNPEEGRKVAAAGHEIGNHTYSHDRMLLVTPSFVRQEIEKTDSLIRSTGYQGEINFRPPFGKKLLALPYYLSRAGRKTIMWDVEPDSSPLDADRITEATTRAVRPGSIILLHVMYPNRRESLKAVRGIIESLRKDRYDFVTISRLIAGRT